MVAYILCSNQLVSFLDALFILYLNSSWEGTGFRVGFQLVGKTTFTIICKMQDISVLNLKGVKTNSAVSEVDRIII